MRHFTAGLIATVITAVFAVPASSHAEVAGPPSGAASIPAALPLKPMIVQGQGDQAFRARLAGTTLRAEVWDGFLQQNHIHRFRADGTVDGEYSARRLIRLGIDFIHEYDQGRWSVDAGRLCVTWHKFFLGRPQCYTLETAAVGWVRFSNIGGGPSFAAQVSR